MGRCFGKSLILAVSDVCFEGYVLVGDFRCWGLFYFLFSVMTNFARARDSLLLCLTIC